MKKFLLACAGLLVAVGAYAQGQVVFANTSTTLISTNNNAGAVGAISGAGNYRVGLYVGPAGSAAEALTLAGSALNSPLAGRFSGGNPFAIPGAPAGTAIAFQVRAWSVAGGATFAEADQSNNPNVYRGVSALGTVTPTAAPNPAAALFGTGPGQIGGFEITPVPEPSSIALGLLGLGAVALFRRRK